MDYRTLFVTFLASLTVYTACACALAWRNRDVRGLAWIAGGLLCALGAFVLQGLEGKVPTFFSSFLSNELYFPAYAMQMIGLSWFVERKRQRWRWTMLVVGFFALLYAVLYYLHVGYVANVINAPTIGLIAATALILLRSGRGIFLQASRWATVFLCGELIVYTYRAVLTNFIYADPWLVSGRQQDPRWLYSMMTLMFFTTCVIMCDFWFFVVELQRELIDQARTDVLTGALNRRALYDEADREISRTARGGRPPCLLLMDIDDFKATNDTHGHAAGDLVLKRLVKQIKSTLRTQDLLARMGGEEFAVLLPETTLEFASVVAERIRLSLQSMSLTFAGVPCPISVSIGIAEVVSPGVSFESIVQRADAAMYAAKRGGKNRIVAFEDHTTPAASGIVSIAH
jgi:diguanylate cyclase (GGDEF)-like protein